ncbi:glycosyltransferase family 4 protein [Gulbenkiania mobilis]|uniref:Glycosyltransferase involved in cell wall biosynthesis n=1 Tax=Gulbenkiania mobilis TaxID=397457 RepID=A0ABY2CZ61_GULMO|nr:glycosyltransferase involved in cell wall biosynthesis [Gulbenkiania mobilis]
MRVLVAANITPFLHGGADYHILGLVEALRRHGHEAELLRLPFVFQPEADIERLMDFCAATDLSAPNGQHIDTLISLQFPEFALRHPNHVAWVMHQHRAVYELYDEARADPTLAALRARITAFDNQALGAVKKRFANSQRVAARLSQFNGLEAEPLYHPPAGAERFHCAPAEPYIFYPSRFETLKRQSLLIEAARHMRSPLGILLAGEGGQLSACKALAERLGVGHRVRFLGRVSEAEKHAFYAHATAVFFGPFDEDYGYITLEAMLSSKPVVTCTDSGGPLEFVLDGETGCVVDPQPEALAEALDRLHADAGRTAAMGRAGRARYDSLGIGWGPVVARLLS